MREPEVKKTTLEELRRMKETGQLFHDPAALAGDPLGPEFWRDALSEPSLPKRHPLKDEKPSHQ